MPVNSFLVVNGEVIHDIRPVLFVNKISDLCALPHSPITTDQLSALSKSDMAGILEALLHKKAYIGADITALVVTKDKKVLLVPRILVTETITDLQKNLVEIVALASDKQVEVAECILQKLTKEELQSLAKALGLETDTASLNRSRKAVTYKPYTIAELRSSILKDGFNIVQSQECSASSSDAITTTTKQPNLGILVDGKPLLIEKKVAKKAETKVEVAKPKWTTEEARSLNAIKSASLKLSNDFKAKHREYKDEDKIYRTIVHTLCDMNGLMHVYTGIGMSGDVLPHIPMKLQAFIEKSTWYKSEEAEEESAEESAEEESAEEEQEEEQEEEESAEEEVPKIEEQKEEEVPKIEEQKQEEAPKAEEQKEDAEWKECGEQSLNIIQKDYESFEMIAPAVDGEEDHGGDLWPSYEEQEYVIQRVKSESDR